VTVIDRSGSALSNRVVITFISRVTVAVIGLFSAFMLARLLGPAEKGEFTVGQILPSTIFVLGQLGLTSALSYYAGRGRTAGLTRRAVILAAVLSAIGIGVTLLLMPFIQEYIFKNIDPVVLVGSLAVVPSLFAFAFMNSILTGRQQMVAYGLLAIGQIIAALILYIALIGVAGLGARGAVLAYFLFSSGTALVAIWAASRATRHPTDEPPARRADLFHYGLRVYPASLSGFFSYRADVIIMAAILASPAAIGLYSFAVGLAELVFFLPDSVVLVFFPHVAGGTREEADATVPMVSRITVTMTGLAALALVPAAIIAVSLVLPAFTDSLPALFILLPGVVALSISKVLSAYLNGLARTTFVSFMATSALILNITMNFLLIPIWGILGAAAASLISYTFGAVLAIAFSSRLSGARPLSFVIPTRQDFANVVAMAAVILGQVRARLRPAKAGA
jgi:O-antigen/teichoic acid export membrane protein